MRPHRRQPTRFPHPWDSPGKNTGAGCHFLLQCMKVKSESEVAQSCPTLSDPMDCNPPGSSVHGVSRQEHWSGVPLPSPHRCSMCPYLERGPCRCDYSLMTSYWSRGGPLTWYDFALISSQPCGGGGFPAGTSGKEPACQCRRHKRYRFDPWAGKIPWRRAWQSTPGFLPGEPQGQRSLAGCSPWGRIVGHNWSDLTRRHVKMQNC